VFKNLKIGKKITVGIGIMVLIISAVMVFTYLNLTQIRDNSTMMDHAYLPEVELTAKLDGSVMGTMYAMRGYGLTGDEKFIGQANELFEEIQVQIAEGEALVAANPRLVKLGEQIGDMRTISMEYADLMKQTEDVYVTIDTARADLDASAAVFVENTKAYEENMLMKLKDQVASSDTVPRLEARIWKVQTIAEVVDFGSHIRIMNFKAQALNDMTYFEEAYSDFDQIVALTEEMRAITTGQLNIDQINGIQTSAQSYRTAMESMEASLIRLNELAVLRDEKGQAMELIAETTFDAGLVQSLNLSNDIVAETGSSITSMIIGFAVALLVGVVINTIIMRGITSRIGKLAAVAEKLAVGDIDVKLEVDSNDEVGKLGQAFQRMTGSIQQQALVAQEIANGNLDADVEVRSEADVLNINFELMLKTLKRLTTDMEDLIVSAKAGDLAVRINSTSYKGGWNDFVSQLNMFVEVVEEPVNYVSNYIDDMAAGNSLQRIVSGSEKSSEYTDSLTGATAKSYSNKFDGDFSKMINNLASVRLAIYTMLGEANTLSEKAQAGNLSHRADTENLNGGWESIMSGFNTAIDTIVLPIEEAAEVLGRMSEGDLHARVMGDYAGDHAKIKNAANSMIDTLTNYIEEIDFVLSQMASGNLDVDVKQDYVGDFQQIKSSLINIVDSFNQTFGDINSAADQVADGSQEVSKSAQALSQGATEQAGSIEEITAAMEELGEKTKDNADSASRARDLSLSAKSDAEMGNSHMNNMIGAMEDINASSTNISKIISVIDEIAFQTNILALNAAVEAARAGEHGKGFAVVAEEVRNLAARSANAAKETTALIESSIDQVNEGTKIANSTADALNQIVTGVTDAAELVNTIADASTEQAASIEQINQGIDEVSTVTQTNSATAQQSAAASEEMSSQAMLLKEMVDKFNFKQAGMGGRKAYVAQSSMTSGKNGSQRKDTETVHIALDDREFGKY